MIGRAGALLIDIPIDTSTTGYRLAQRVGAATRTARDLLARDLDALEEAWELAGRRGTDQPVKVQAVGPLTLASQLELHGGHRVLTDPGALRDVAESLAEGVANHVADTARRLGSPVVVQLDEPGLPAVLAGSLSGVSILQTPRALPEPEALHVLQQAIGRIDAPVLVHCCASDVPWGLLRRSGAAMVGFDVDTLGTSDLDGIGELLDGGVDLALGLVPTVSPSARPAGGSWPSPRPGCSTGSASPRTAVVARRCDPGVRTGRREPGPGPRGAAVGERCDPRFRGRGGPRPDPLRGLSAAETCRLAAITFPGGPERSPASVTISPTWRLCPRAPRIGSAGRSWPRSYATTSSATTCSIRRSSPTASSTSCSAN